MKVEHKHLIEFLESCLREGFEIHMQPLPHTVVSELPLVPDRESVNYRIKVTDPIGSEGNVVDMVEDECLSDAILELMAMRLYGIGLKLNE